MEYGVIQHSPRFSNPAPGEVPSCVCVCVRERVKLSLFASLLFARMFGWQVNTIEVHFFPPYTYCISCLVFYASVQLLLTCSSTLTEFLLVEWNVPKINHQHKGGGGVQSGLDQSISDPYLTSCFYSSYQEDDLSFPGMCVCERGPAQQRTHMCTQPTSMILTHTHTQTHTHTHWPVPPHLLMVLHNHVELSSWVQRNPLQIPLKALRGGGRGKRGGGEGGN